MFPQRSFILGGARSGKSQFAEGLVAQSGKNPVYIATAQAFDAEMKARIATHQTRREYEWRTIEAPLNVATALASLENTDVVLLDCATLWLSNQMLAENDIDAAMDFLLQALGDCPAKIVVVSNEVGQSVVPENALARRFRDAQGTLNQRLAAWADLAVLVTAGLPQVLKGKLP